MTANLLDSFYPSQQASFNRGHQMMHEQQNNTMTTTTITSKQQQEEEQQQLTTEGHKNTHQEADADINDLHNHNNNNNNNNNMIMMIEPCMLVPRPNHHPSPTTVGDDSSDENNNNFTMLFPHLVPPPSVDDCNYQNYYQELQDKLSIMKHLEETRYQPQDYLPQRTPQRYEQRRMTVEYLYQVVDYGNFQRDVVSYSMTHLLDRYLAAQAQQQQQPSFTKSRKMSNKNMTSMTNTKNPIEDPNQYQLVALTCLYMAVKMLEPQNIGVDSLIPLANGMYTREQFLDMEMSILHTLDWSLGAGPTPLSFVQLILPFVALALNNLNHSNNNIDTESILTSLYNQVQYQCELGVADYDVCCAKPSDIAIAALWNGLESLVQGSLISHQEQYMIQQCILRYTTTKNYHHDVRLPLLTQYHLTNLQSRLRHLTTTAYSSFTTTTTITTTRTTSAATTESRSYKREGGCGSTSAVKHGRRGRTTTTTTTTTTLNDHNHDSSPAGSWGQDSFNDVAEVDWLQYT